MRVALGPFGDRSGDLNEDFQPLGFGQRADGVQRLVDALAHGEPGTIGLQAAGLDARKIKQVVDQSEQVPGRGAYRIVVFPLLGVQFTARQQIGEPEYAVEGRADLVAHIGQKLALGTVGIFGFGLEPGHLSGVRAEFRLGSLALADVAGHSQEGLRLPVGDGAIVDLEGNRSAVFSQLHGFKAGLSVFPNGREPSGQQRRRLRRIDLLNTHAHQFVAGVAQIPARGLVHFQQTPGEIRYEDGIVG